jgi:hypothetical protein
MNHDPLTELEGSFQPVLLAQSLNCAQRSHGQCQAHRRVRSEHITGRTTERNQESQRLKENVCCIDWASQVYTPISNKEEVLFFLFINFLFLFYFSLLHCYSYFFYVCHSLTKLSFSTVHCILFCIPSSYIVHSFPIPFFFLFLTLFYYLAFNSYNFNNFYSPTF